MSERTDTKRSILACSASLKRRRASLVNVCSLTPSDLTVLAPPDDEVLPDQAGAYGALVDAATPLPIADMTETAEASLLSLDGEWFGCKAERIGYALWLSDAAKGIEGGMMGSPILVNDRAVGVVSTPSTSETYAEAKAPALTECLPRWLVRELLTAVRA
jgi:hypothetical protein